MKKTGCIAALAVLLFACGDGRSNAGPTNGPGTMPADPQVMRQNQLVPASAAPAPAAAPVDSAVRTGTPPDSARR